MDLLKSSAASMAMANFSKQIKQTIQGMISTENASKNDVC